ncbi:hypothetical protein D3C76_1845620 [compost metagenome]
MSKLLRRKTKGEINYFLAIGIVAVALIVLGWPLIKSVTKTLFTQVQTWFSTNGAAIFTGTATQTSP